MLCVFPENVESPGANRSYLSESNGRYVRLHTVLISAVAAVGGYAAAGMKRFHPSPFFVAGSFMSVLFLPGFSCFFVCLQPVF